MLDLTLYAAAAAATVLMRSGLRAASSNGLTGMLAAVELPASRELAASRAGRFEASVDPAREGRLAIRLVVDPATAGKLASRGSWNRDL